MARVVVAQRAGTCGCGCKKSLKVNTDQIVHTQNKGWVLAEHAAIPRPGREEVLLHGLQPLARYGQNPWVTEAMNGSVAHAFGESGVYFSEYASADAMPPVPCGVCQEPAWFKPTVGAYVCSCGAIKTGHGWITR